MAASRPRKAGKRSGTSPPGRRGRDGREGREIVSEADEILEQMCTDLCLLHEQRHGGGEISPDLVNRLFRSAHTLKGLAGLADLGALRRLAHRLEDVLDGLRLGRIPQQAGVLGLLDEGVAAMVALVASLPGESAAQDRAAREAEALLARLDAALEAPPPTAGLPSLALDATVLRALTEYEEHRLRESLARGRAVVLIDAIFDLTGFEEGLAEISAALREAGEVISTLPSAAASCEQRICFSLLVATALDPDLLLRRIDQGNASLRVVHPGAPRPAVAAPVGDERGQAARADAGVVDRDGAIDESEPESAGDPGARIESLRSIGGSVRVDIKKLDSLMNLVGEMATHRNALAGIVSQLASDPRNARVGAELAKVHKLIDRRLKDLQSGVLDVRMVPLRQVFDKLSRVVRRLRVDLGKDALLTFTGGDTELDKLIVEQLVDPLVHVVRNAFDHALESPEERELLGKAPIGSIRIAAFQRGNHVVLEVVDDGRGMDVEAIRRKAVERGLLAASVTVPDREILDLVFEPGLSTRETVSETSGRGVGMDVVRSNLGALGGVVEVSSAKGAGTTIAITLPITLAIFQALIVRVAEERYAIPLASVQQTLALDSYAIQQTEDRALINLRGTPLVLHRLSDELEVAGAAATLQGFIVVVSMGDQRLGLVVDGLVGQRDVVIKPIQGPFRQIRGIAGATELGDGAATLVLDVTAILSDATRRREAA
ncbi:MAG: chemotaxis protein CheA [Myxococcota bacterium]